MLLDIDLHYANGDVVTRLQQGSWQLFNGPIKHPVTKRRPIKIHVHSKPKVTDKEFAAIHHDLRARCDATSLREVSYGD